jgi:glycine betaine/proline transport system permease protein
MSKLLHDSDSDTPKASVGQTLARSNLIVRPAFLFLIFCVVILVVGAEKLPWAFEYPQALIIPFDRWISQFMNWLVNDAHLGFFTFTEFTRGIAQLIEMLGKFATRIFALGFSEGFGPNKVEILPPVSWLAIVLIFFLSGLYAKGLKLACMLAGCFAYLAVFGQWDSSMLTLASIAISIPFGVLGGLLLGLIAFKAPRFEMVLRPVLDLMQTMPVFSYLVPIVFLFGFGPTAAIVATVIYAMPPMARITIVALSNVPKETTELGRMTGCTPRQMLMKVYLPSARPGLMIGVNQVIMLSLNMVIIASMIGAGGLGYDVLTSLRRLDVGGGIESGLAIVVLAIALDRLSQAVAKITPYQNNVLTFRKLLLAIGGIVLLTYLAGQQWAWIQHYPKDWLLSLGNQWSDWLAYINQNYYDELETFKYFILLNLMLPLKNLLLSIPWVIVVTGLGLLGLRLGGAKLMLACVSLSLMIATTGLWTEAIISVYLCGVAIFISALIGLPLGIFAYNRGRLWQVVQVVIDTLQTLPTFVYLIPVVMLFQIGDFSAVIAIVAYAVAPMVRYVAHGFQQVNHQMVEAGIVSGCTPWQLLWKVKIRLALPEILLGLNQTILLALSMLVITALVGTKDLGQETYIALTKADTGRGLVAGFAVAAIAIIVDRLIVSSSRKLKKH